jgi:hypothetical protein
MQGGVLGLKTVDVFCDNANKIINLEFCQQLN